ncbi:MAG: threonine ammonia-lyase [Actinobacteria bacterium]|nr:threonine ammonia-lyase [Actinomycetota bacterium]
MGRGVAEARERPLGRRTRLRAVWPGRQTGRLHAAGAVAVALVAWRTVTTTTGLVSVDEVRAAAQRLTGVLRPTPTEVADTLSRLCGRPILLKPEHRQRTGSFKIRGAYHHISSLPRDGTRVVAASAGNHAQGVALAASLVGVPARIFMPVAAPLPKVEATRAYGAEVVLLGETVDEALAAAVEDAATSGARFVPPFDDPLIIAGQGTIGLELVAEAPGAEVVVVPVGGGGLISGIAVALKALQPSVRVVGVQAERAAAMVVSVAAGEPTRLDHVSTIADGIALKCPTALTVAHVAELVDELVTVSEEEIGRALILLLERTKAVVEPAGAVGLAALLAGKVGGDGPAVAVLSGGNVDPLMLVKLIEHGLSASGRFLRLRIVALDRPGALAAITNRVAELGLNIVAVEHHRAGVTVGVNEVEMLLTLETRDPDHRLRVVDLLRADGWVVDLVG